ncbi:hypothetical protein E2542_SST19449 [Spatholobus suberectus]|nr:hypothetical protein E2542_SST19449 [Spatholobus suberectus]
MKRKIQGDHMAHHFEFVCFLILWMGCLPDSLVSFSVECGVWSVSQSAVARLNNFVCHPNIIFISSFYATVSLMFVRLYMCNCTSKPFCLFLLYSPHVCLLAHGLLIHLYLAFVH